MLVLISREPQWFPWLQVSPTRCQVLAIPEPVSSVATVCRQRRCPSHHIRVIPRNQFLNQITMNSCDSFGDLTGARPGMVSSLVTLNFLRLSYSFHLHIGMGMCFLLLLTCTIWPLTFLVFNRRLGRRIFKIYRRAFFFALQVLQHKVLFHCLVLFLILNLQTPNGNYS